MVLRIGGLASGMDIDSIVSELMTAERVPLDKLNQKKTYTEWQRDDYREMKTLLFELDQLIFNNTSKQSAYIKKTITSSNENAVSIKNISSTVDFSGSIKVTRLASAATMSSNGSTNISNYQTASTLDSYGITGTKITINAIGKDGTLQAKDISIDPAVDTLDSVISKINTESGVTAFYDSASNQFSLIAKNTGDRGGLTDPEITLSTDGNLLSILNLSSDNLSGSGTAGQNAEINYNGISINRPSNTFQINGVEFSFKQETGTTPVTFSSSPDVDSILKTVTDFVDKYNTMIEKVQVKLTEAKFRDYQPLTDAQREGMTEDQIEQWEKKAKSGTLRNDSILSSVLTKMRMDNSTINTNLSSFKSLSEIGITTSRNYLAGGKLEINEEKLRAAISSNPNGIYELFQGNGSTSNEGIATKLRKTLKTAMTDIESKAGKTSSSVNNTFTLGRFLNNYDDQISRMKNRLIDIESRYWRQFTAMETAINKSNSQSAYLSQYFV